MEKNIIRLLKAEEIECRMSYPGEGGGVQSVYSYFAFIYYHVMK